MSNIRPARTRAAGSLTSRLFSVQGYQVPARRLPPIRTTVEADFSVGSGSVRKSVKSWLASRRIIAPSSGLSGSCAARWTAWRRCQGSSFFAITPFPPLTNRGIDLLGEAVMIADAAFRLSSSRSRTPPLAHVRLVAVSPDAAKGRFGVGRFPRHPRCPGRRVRCHPTSRGLGIANLILPLLGLAVDRHMVFGRVEESNYVDLVSALTSFLSLPDGPEDFFGGYRRWTNSAPAALSRSRGVSTDVFVGGVLCTLSAWVMERCSFGSG